ncbi:MAG: NlpC/P60 family protein [Cyclobacteriaceae bacterium]
MNSCSPVLTNQQEGLDEIISTIKSEYALDTRLVVFDVKADVDIYNKKIVLKGETSLQKAKEALLLAMQDSEISFVDSVLLLPEEADKYGIIKLSVANLRSRPAHSAELSTQALMGTPVKILKTKGSWHLIQSPDKYISWVDGGGIHIVDNAGKEEWLARQKLIFLGQSNFGFSEPSLQSTPVTDLVNGNILAFIEEDSKWYKVALPDGREAFVEKTSSKPVQNWLSEIERSEPSLIKTAKQMTGLPYLWGGTSSKGVDCSGFTKTIYLLHGIVIPRDADQQSKAGSLVDNEGDFSKLMPGDLLFFGRQASDSTSERITHVGMWIGQNEFIHSAGRVHVSSVDAEADNYDDFNTKRYIRSTRIFGYEDDPGFVDLKQTFVF